MWNAYRNGDWDSVRKEQNKLASLMRIVLAPSGVQGFGSGVGAFKTAMALLGVFDTNQMPEPVLALHGDNVKAIANVLRACGVELARTVEQVEASTE